MSETTALDLPSWIEAIATAGALGVTITVLLRDKAQQRRKEAALLHGAAVLVSTAANIASRIEYEERSWHPKDSRPVTESNALNAIQTAIDSFPAHDIGSSRAITQFFRARSAVSHLQNALSGSGVNRSLGIATSVGLLARINTAIWAEVDASPDIRRAERVKARRRKWLRKRTRRRVRTAQLRSSPVQ